MRTYSSLLRFLGTASDVTTLTRTGPVDHQFPIVIEWAQEGIAGLTCLFMSNWPYIDIASYTLMLVTIGQSLAIFSASSMFSALMMV